MLCALALANLKLGSVQYVPAAEIQVGAIDQYVQLVQLVFVHSLVLSIAHFVRRLCYSSARMGQLELFQSSLPPPPQRDSEAIPNSEREKNNRSGLIPRALGPTKTSLNCLK